jgi:hypothetical protein
MFGRRRTVDPGIPEHVTRRVAKLSTEDLVMWADQAIYTSGRYLTLHLKDRTTPEYLNEATTGAQVLLAIVTEIRRRETPPA